MDAAPLSGCNLRNFAKSDAVAAWDKVGYSERSDVDMDFVVWVERLKDHRLDYILSVLVDPALNFSEPRVFARRESPPISCGGPARPLAASFAGLRSARSGRNSFLLLFGEIHPDQESVYQDRISLSRQPTSLSDKTLLWRQFDNSAFSSVLNLTGYGVHAYESTAYSIGSNHFNVVWGSSFEALCMFWNVRAIDDLDKFRNQPGRRTILLPPAFDRDRFGEFVKTKLEHPHLSSNLHILFQVWNEEDKGKLEELLGGLSTVDRFPGTGVSIEFGSTTGKTGQAEPNVKYRFLPPDLPNSVLVGIDRDPPVNTSIAFGVNELSRVVPNQIQASRGTVAVDVQTPLWKRYPRSQTLARRLLPKGIFTEYGLSCYVELSRQSFQLTVDVADECETLKVFFAEKRCQLKISRCGGHGEAIIRLAGGVDGVGVLACQLAVDLLGNLATKSSKKLAQRIRQELKIDEDQGTNLEELLRGLELVAQLRRVPRSCNELKNILKKHCANQLLPLIEKLVGREIIKRGYYLQCQNCQLPAWYPLTVMGERLTCPGCSYRFQLPVEYPVGSGREIEWKYALNSLIDRGMDQDVLPAVLALHHLARGNASTCRSIGLEVMRNNVAVTEFDLLFVLDGEVHAGECKVGAELGEKDFNTCKVANEMGIRYFYYCTLSESFTEDTQKRIDDLRAQLSKGDVKTKISILTAKDLLENLSVQTEVWSG